MLSTGNVVRSELHTEVAIAGATDHWKNNVKLRVLAHGLARASVRSITGWSNVVDSTVGPTMRMMGITILDLVKTMKAGSEATPSGLDTINVAMYALSGKMYCVGISNEEPVGHAGSNGRIPPDICQLYVGDPKLGSPYTTDFTEKPSHTPTYVAPDNVTSGLRDPAGKLTNADPLDEIELVSHDLIKEVNEF
jgi:hypothetical protein